MKNLFTIVIGLSLSVFLAGCALYSSDGVDEISEPSIDVSEEAVVDLSFDPDLGDDLFEDLQIVEVGSYASCFTVELQDMDGNTITVPTAVKESFDCVTGAVALAINSEYLLYDHYNEETDDIDLLLYHVPSDSSEWLMSFLSSREGIKCIWNDVNTHIACAVVNQSEYSGNTKIFILEITKGKLVQKQVFPQDRETMMHYVCGASCYPENLWFEGENTLKYNGHEMISPSKVYTINF